jgi:hypothetical protein
VIPGAGLGYLLNPDGSSCYGRSPGADHALHDNSLATDFAVGNGKFDTPMIPALGEPAFGDFAGGISFLAPATGLIRALDLALPEYQGGQDLLGAWDVKSGQFRPGFPSPVNDLQFLTGPSVADIDGKPGEELVGGSSSLDLNALTSTGAAVPGWPKLTTDWTVANPVIGSFGGSADKVVVDLTRSGYLLAYRTTAPVCSPGSWPRFHHDDANSGDYARDATPPGHPYRARLAGQTLALTAPGGDLLCGRAARYRVVEDGKTLSRVPAPAEAGARQTITLPGRVKRYVSVRAVDEQGNVGPALVVRTR